MSDDSHPPVRSSPLPKVSVALVTYNHEKFIAQAVEGVLLQRTTFPIELVIGEDCSTDGTRAIVQNYARDYPHIVRPLLHERNMGAGANYEAILAACKGEYIAYLDGDDYWTSSIKLQKQVDFLDQHRAYSAHSHNASIVQDKSSESRHAFCDGDVPLTLTLEDLLCFNPIPTCAIVFRRKVLKALPNWFFDLPVGDWGLNVVNAMSGPIRYDDSIMSAYRVHCGGVWSKKTSVEGWQTRIEIYTILNRVFGSSHGNLLRDAISSAHFRIACEYERAGNRSQARAGLKRSLRISPFNRTVRTRDIIKLIGRLYQRRVFLLAKKCGLVEREIGL